VNYKRVIALVFITLTILSCSSPDRKIQTKPIEQNTTPSIKQEAPENQPEKTEAIIKESPTKTIEEQPGEILLPIENKEENLVAETPKNEMSETTFSKKEPKAQKIEKKEISKTTTSVQKPIKQDIKKNVIKKPMTNQNITLKGKININDNKAKVASTVIYFTPDDGHYSVEPRSDFSISTKNKRFEPNVLVIPVGSEVKFPNLDRILHNVFSVSGNQEFDLGLYSAGTVKSVKFDLPGVVYVHCNVHHSMQADILVVESPWYTNVNDDGSFSLENVPDKPGTLHVWHPRSNLKKLKINKKQNNTFDIDIKITRKKVPKHLNKFGKSYRPKERY
jgi:plastocyanin